MVYPEVDPAEADEGDGGQVEGDEEDVVLAVDGDVEAVLREHVAQVRQRLVVVVVRPLVALHEEVGCELVLVHARQVVAPAHGEEPVVVLVAAYADGTDVLVEREVHQLHDARDRDDQPQHNTTHMTSHHVTSPLFMTSDMTSHQSSDIKSMHEEQ